MADEGILGQETHGVLDDASAARVMAEFPAEKAPDLRQLARQFVGDVDTLHDDDAEDRLVILLQSVLDAGMRLGGNGAPKP